MAVSEALRVIDLGPGDVEGGMALSTEAGWNQTRDDWRHFTGEGRVIGVRGDDGRLVASAAALPYEGPFGFVGMVLVTPAFRRRGIATELVDRCIAELKRQGLTPALDATADGAKVYARQGFLPQFGFDRWEGTVEGQALGEKEPGKNDPARIAELDGAAFGARRPGLIRDFLGREETHAIVSYTGDGFAMIRQGRRALQAGPVVAASEEVALDLIQRLFAGVSGSVFIDVPSAWKAIGRWLGEQGFVIQRSFTRMALGRAEPFGTPEHLFAVAGPEFG